MNDFRDNFFSSLLNNIFRLMPVEMLQDNKNKGLKVVEIFSTEPSLDFGGNNPTICLANKLLFGDHLFIIFYRELD